MRWNPLMVRTTRLRI
uniref:Uncharacterized protein n=1 Tax=Arundo donax TaxID=35708 RepID=A0A0A9B551_ARUDO